MRPTIAEQLEKEQAAQAQAYQATCGQVKSANTLRADCGYDQEPCRTPLRDQIASQLHRSLREGNKASRLQELAYLLDKNPDVARILDLIEEVR